MQIVFATNNQHKVDEIKAVIPATLNIITLKDAGIDIDIPEPHQTLEENAREKARTIYQRTGLPCFGEDTGLEVEALNGEPGVLSARYAGEDKSFSKNTEKLLANLQPHQNRSAQFRTVICFMIDGEEHFFEGICKGTIINEPTGAAGFGYDPVFVPEGADKTFAQMDLQQKNEYSHRRKAVDSLVTFLKQLNDK